MSGHTSLALRAPPTTCGACRSISVERLARIGAIGSPGFSSTYVAEFHTLPPKTTIGVRSCSASGETSACAAASKVM